MTKLWSGLCATTLAFSFAASTIVPAAAAPVFVPKAAPAASAADVQLVDHTRRHRRMERREDRRERRMERREDRRERRADRREARFEQRGNWWYYNGHRGYRERRDGYRYYNGFWFPAGAFLAGALITGAIASQPSVTVIHRGGSAHTEWCYNRYRSYRAWDNTFQPYSDGRYTPREQCYSPYD